MNSVKYDKCNFKQFVVSFDSLPKRVREKRLFLITHALPILPNHVIVIYVATIDATTMPCL